MTSHILDVIEVTKVYRQDNRLIRVLEDVSFSLDEGRVLSVIGFESSGSSTLLSIVTGMEAPTSGKVLFRGNEVTKPPKEIRLAFRSPTLLPWLTIRKNIEFALSGQRMSKADKIATVNRWIKLLSLEKYENCYPKDVPLLVQQKTNIARAFVSDPEIVIFDDPFSPLDQIDTERLKTTLNELWEETRKSMFIVTRLASRAIELADKVIVLSKIPSKVKEKIDVDMKKPRDEKSPRFLELLRRIAKSLKEEQEGEKE